MLNTALVPLKPAFQLKPVWQSKFTVKPIPRATLTRINRPFLPTQDDLPYEDNENMETERHKKQMELLINSLQPWLDQHQGGYVNGNMFVYYSALHVRNQDFKGPDVFVVLNVSNRERKSWVLWEEGKGPDVVIELLSDTTSAADKQKKKQIYQTQLQVAEYFWFDPFNPNDWKGFYLTGGVYEERKPQRGCLLSRALGLNLIHWRGVHKNIDTVWLRWATLAGELLLLPEEAAAQRAAAEAQRAEVEAQRAAAEAQRADTEAQRADTEAQRAAVETQRADIEAQRAEAEAQRAEAEAQRADTEAQRAAVETQRADIEAQRAAVEAQRAEMAEQRVLTEAEARRAEAQRADLAEQRAKAAEAELAQLKALLANRP